jgi:hypothetical protein
MGIGGHRHEHDVLRRRILSVSHCHRLHDADGAGMALPQSPRSKS